MRYTGIINNLSKIVVSDPHYLQDVWCRYDKNLEKAENWKVIMLIKEVDEMQKYEDEEFNIKGLDFSILIKKEKCISNLLDIGKYTHAKGTILTDTEIGIDTAQVCMGVNEKAIEINNYAKKINSNKNIDTLLTEYNPQFAIQTMSDGMLGTVTEGIRKGETEFILINGFFDECANVNTVDELKNYIVKQLNIKNLELCKDAIKIDMDNVDYDY